MSMKKRVLTKLILSIGSFLLITILLYIFSMKVSPQENNLGMNEKVIEIEMVTWETEEHVGTIDDAQFINELIDDLNEADTLSTNALKLSDFPPYKLVFKNSEGEVLHTLGYFKSPVMIGISGQYWEFNRIFGLEKNIPSRFFD